MDAHLVGLYLLLRNTSLRSRMRLVRGGGAGGGSAPPFVGRGPDVVARHRDSWEKQETQVSTSWELSQSHLWWGLSLPLGQAFEVAEMWAGARHGLKPCDGDSVAAQRAERCCRRAGNRVVWERGLMTDLLG